MSRRPASSFPTAALWIVLPALALSARPADAAVVVTDSPVFVVAIDNNDAVSVDCSGGFVRVFDDGTPTTYASACAAVTNLAAVMFLVSRPGIPAALLALAGALFGALHPPPTGPPGAICFLAAAAYWEFVGNRERELVVPTAA